MRYKISLLEMRLESAVWVSITHHLLSIEIVIKNNFND